MKSQTAVAFVFVIILVSLMSVSASLGTFQTNDCVPIRVLANCTSINLTEVTSLNQTYIINQPMTFLGGQTFNYSFCNTSDIGTYTYSWNNPCVDCSNGNCGNSFIVTSNGKDAPSGGVIVLFIILFAIVLGCSAYMVIYGIGHTIALDFDVVDVAFNFGLYFVTIALYGFERFYLGNPMIHSYLSTFLLIGGFILIFFPLIAFILSITIGSLMKKKPDFNGGVTQKLSFRRNR